MQLETQTVSEKFLSHAKHRSFSQREFIPCSINSLTLLFYYMKLTLAQKKKKQSEPMPQGLKACRSSHSFYFYLHLFIYFYLTHIARSQQLTGESRASPL